MLLLPCAPYYMITRLLVPLDDTNFYTAIASCLADYPVNGSCSASVHGAMPDWNVSIVTNMAFAFRGEPGVS